jgi:transposase
MAHAKGQVVVTVAQRAVLERLVRAYTTPQHIAQRARIVLMSAEGRRNVDQAAVLGTDTQRIRRWRRRWADAQPAIAASEVTEGEAAYVDDLILDLLHDEQRPGRKPVFTAEQIAQIIAVGCETPSEESDRPVSHWTPRELADEVMKRGIVATISPRHVGRILEEADLRPHRSRYWLQREDQGHRPRSVRAGFDRGVRGLSNRG